MQICRTDSGPLVAPNGTSPPVAVPVSKFVAMAMVVPFGPGNWRVKVAPCANIPEIWRFVSAAAGWGDIPVITGVGGTRLTVVTPCAPGLATETACMAADGTTLLQANVSGVKTPEEVMFPALVPAGL